jgi:hypothetical protein
MKKKEEGESRETAWGKTPLNNRLGLWGIVTISLIIGFPYLLDLLGKICRHFS